MLRLLRLVLDREDMGDPLPPLQHGALRRVEIDRAWFCDRRGAAVYRLSAECVGQATPTTTEKRFSDFHSLHKHLIDRFGELTLQDAGIPPIPSKKLLGNRDANL
eukprot:COSAG06_NODE_25890_length_626_cov_1.421252_1_plen_104_part_01